MSHTDLTPATPGARAPSAAFSLFAGLVTMTGLLMSLSGTAQQAQPNLLESINTSTLQGGKVILRANFKEPLAVVPPGFTVTNPARIALDLPNVVNGLGKNTVEIAEGDVRSVSVVESSGKTRMVVNLTRSLTYSTALDGSSLVITIDGGLPSVVKDAIQTTKFAESAPTSSEQKFNIRDVDFRRGANGEGRIIVDLSSANTGIDIRLQGKNVIVDFINTSAPRNLLRRLDVLDFATPVRLVDLVSQGATTRMIIEPKGLWEYSAYQTDTQFIVEVKQLKEDPNKLVQGLGYNGEKLSLNFQNVEVRAVLQVIADFTGLNIITSDTVGGSLTLRLKDVPWDQALDIILQAKGLSKRKSGNVVLIAPSDELATKEKLALEASQQISELEPLRTESFQLSYTKATDVQGLITNKDQNILSKRGRATSDGRTNTLFVNDTPTKLDEVRKLIAQLDVPVRQVMIEARIVIADDKFSRELGARFGFIAGGNSNGRNYGFAPDLNASAAVAGGTLNCTVPANVNLPVAGAAGTIGLSILNIANSNLVSLELSALESDGRGKVVSSPRIITADKRKATISQGTEIPYQTQSSSGGSTTQFKQAVLSLDVTPQITPDDKVIMDIEIKKDSESGRTAQSGIPILDVRNLRTQILVENGETAVLGGIFEQSTSTNVTKVPFLGDIPFIGNAFKKTQRIDNKTELLVFITPRIIKDQLNLR
ncbi:MAG: type IV pilus secretin PilQ [Burkholderiales bacterium]|nr:type IV pilus secretin PilQ [Burkholderiales bacterium]